MQSDIKANKQKTDVSIWLLFVAAFIIVIFFFWYFFIYVNNQEELLVQKSFRVLTQVGENFKNRYDSYYSIVNATDMTTLLNKCDKDLNETKNDIKRYTFGIEIIESSKPVNNNYIYIKDDSIKIKKTVKYLKENNINDTKTKDVYFRISKDDFFQPLKSKDVFEEIIVVKNFPKSNINEFFYSSIKGELEVAGLDSIIMPYPGISSGIVTEAKISGNDYKLFLTKVNLKNGGNYYVGGVISTDRYIEETRAINSYTIMLILFLFITFLLSIPLFKLRMISENQQLKTSDLLLSTLSIILGTCFILLVFLSILGYSNTNKKINTSLKVLSDSIKYNFIREIDNIDGTIDLFKTNSLIKGKLQVLNRKKIKLGDSTVIAINDSVYIGLKNLTEVRLSNSTFTSGRKLIFIKQNDTTYFNLNDILYFKLNNTIYSRLNDLTFINLNNQTYKYFKLIFDLDKTGQQVTIISSREKKSSPDNYSYRKYFIESGEWHLNGSRLMLDFII